MDEIVIDATEQTAAGGGDPLQQELAEKDAELLARSESERELLARYREVLLASDTGVDPALVEGETLAAIDESFLRARETADLARGSLGPGLQRVSPGAPGRRKLGPTTPFEKIREGLSRRAG
ncbi:MAG: hypothetical protein KC482_11430 [Dehalococcoidia bacterium]|nr:hypothetical protein [Dehalococcoidia bacterium]MCA9854186.1 hypothetical protein [Dehalococcoidia bacterium]